MPIIFIPNNADPEQFIANLTRINTADSLPVIVGGTDIQAHGFSLFADGATPGVKLWYLPDLSRGEPLRFSFISRGDLLAEVVIPIARRTCLPIEGVSINEIPVSNLTATLEVIRLNRKKAAISAKSLQIETRSPAGATPMSTGSPIEELVARFDVEPALIRDVHAALAFKRDEAAVVHLRGLYDCLVVIEPTRRVEVRQRPPIVRPRPRFRRRPNKVLHRLGDLDFDFEPPDVSDPPESEPVELMEPVEIELRPRYEHHRFEFSAEVITFYSCEESPDRYQLDRGAGPHPMGCDLPPARDTANEVWSEQPGVHDLADVYKSNFSGFVRVVPRFFAAAVARPNVPSVHATISFDASDRTRCFASFDFELAPRFDARDLEHIKNVTHATRATQVHKLAPIPLSWNDASGAQATLLPTEVGVRLSLLKVELDKVPELLVRLKAGLPGGSFGVQVATDQVVAVAFTLGGNDVAGTAVPIDPIELDIGLVTRTIVVTSSMDLAARKIKLLEITVQVNAGGGEHEVLIGLEPGEMMDWRNLELPFSEAASEPIFTYTVRALLEDGSEQTRGPFEQRLWGHIMLKSNLFD